MAQYKMMHLHVAFIDGVVQDCLSFVSIQEKINSVLMRLITFTCLDAFYDKIWYVIEAKK